MAVLQIGQDGSAISIGAEEGEKLSTAIWLSPLLPPNPLCNGLGRCGRCRVRFLDSPPAIAPEERDVLTETELAGGWRLACRHTMPEGGLLRLELPQGPKSTAAPADRILAGAGYLGVDLGTTSIQWRLMDDKGMSLAEGSTWNPQGGAGADVISRLQAASSPEGLERLSALVRSALSAIAESLDKDGARIKMACVAANSAMTEIMLRADIGGLLAAPWQLSMHGGEILALPLDPAGGQLPAVIPPLLSPFVGGDVSAGIWALLRRGTERPFLLIDMGTNAEVAVCAEDGRLWLASAPLGPALEGIGPCCGQPAGPAVITRFSLGPAGLVPHFYNNEIPRQCAGISATGYISLLAILLNSGFMCPDGALNPQPAMPMARKIARQMEPGRLNLPCGQYLTPFDIETLLKVKAALAVAVERVLTAAGIGVSAVKRLCIAGALGAFAQMSDLAALGFIPALGIARAEAVGNSSLDGACLLAVHPEGLAELSAICGKAHVLNLAEDEHFLASYLDAMCWGQ